MDHRNEVAPPGPPAGNDDATASLVQRNPREQDGPEPATGDVLAQRFRLIRELGRGGAGIVFCAEDLRQSGTRVALKVLRSLGPNAIYRLKSEFRSLAEVSHVNLVALHELFFEDEQWFFTMDLVEGHSFFQHVVDPQAPRGRHICDLDRLRHVLRQLAHAVMAIHATDKLHRDLKPSNVLVTHEGRVVVVDFGLVRAREMPRAGITEMGFVGTPYYAAPEQGDARRASPALDWYAVGVMLYEALTGAGPYDGTQTLAPPSSRVSGVPAELDDLCMRLLASDPLVRAEGRDILRALPVTEVGPVAGPVSLHAAPAEDFVGRAQELAAIGEALERVRRGEQAFVLVSGPSGAGKTRLAERFLGELEARGELEVFAGRCYAHEQLPYKAFDSAIDQVSSFLGRLPNVECAALLPRDTHALTQVFPVLKRLHAVDLIRRRLGRDPTAHRQRERAFVAFKQLLGGVADRTPAALFVDDLQWADVDSIRLLSDLVAQPDAPALLILATYRSEEREQSAALRELFESGAARGAREIHLDTLSEPESRELAMRLAKAEGIASESIVQRMVAEAGGHPLFLGELARYLSTQSGSGRVSLSEALGARVGGLSPASRDLLELICVAGRPVAREVMNVCIEGGATAASWSELRASRLVRVRTEQGDMHFEAYHDRVREEIVRRLSPTDLSSLHARLAAGYAKCSPVDSLAVVEHLVAAGRPSEALPFASEAAQRMAEKLAFGNAIDLLQLVLAHSRDTDERVRLRLRLIELLVADLQSKAAADLCLETAAEVPEAKARDLKRRALELYLAASHHDEANALLDDLCADAGLAHPRAGWMSLLRAAPTFLWLLLRGGPSWREFERARERGPDDHAVWRGWLAWSAYMGLTTDITRSVYYYVQMLLLAPRSGDPELFALARGWWNTFRRVLRIKGVSEDEARVAQLAEGAAPHVRGWLRLQRAIWEGYEGEYERMLEELEHVGADSWNVFEGGSSPGFVVFTGQLNAAYWGGRMVEFRQLFGRMLETADRADDRNFTHRFQEWRMAHALTLGDAEGTRDAHDRAVSIGLSFDPPRILDPWWESMVLLAEGQAVRAAEAFRARARSYNWKVDRVIRMNVMMQHWYGGLAEVAAWGQSGDTRYLRGIRRHVRALKRVRHRWQPALLAQLEGLLAAAQGDSARAGALLELAAARFDQIGHFASAESTRVRLGMLIEGDEGRRMRKRAWAQLQELGIRDPGMWMSVYCPEPCFQALRGSLSSDASGR